MSANKFGFYEVNNKQTFSKLESIQWANGAFPEWNFNREIFNAVDWYTNPKTPLWDLYKARAKQIRESYDYCVLFYSGGSDSHNLLSAWLDADCKIDEIASFWNIEATKDPQSFMCAEIQNVVFPHVEQLRKQGHEFKFRLIDICQLTHDFLDKHKTDYSYYCTHAVSPNNIIKGMFRERIKDWMELITQGKKLCFIWGSEKPQVFVDNKGWYFQFGDFLNNTISPYTQERYDQGWYDELFYWTPDMPSIVIQQAHDIKNFLSFCKDTSFFQKEKSAYGYSKLLDMYVSHNGVKRIIYPKWNPLTFTNGKSPTGASNYLVYSPRDQWILPDFIDAIETTINYFPDYWKQGPAPEFYKRKNLTPLKIKAHVQRHYFA